MQHNMTNCRPARRDVLRLLALGTLGLAAGGWGRDARAAATRIRMACWSQPLSEQTHLFAAEAFGWFEAAGLDFSFVPGNGGGVAIKHLLAGNADIAFTNIEPVLFATEQGARLKAIYNIYPQNVFNVVALKSSGITRPEDLKGKRIGVYSLESGTRHNLRIILRAVGLDESDVEVIPTGVLNFGPLMQGRVDATAATDTGLWLARSKGLGETHVIQARDYLNTPTDAFIVTRDYYEQNPQLLREFLRVYRRAATWMIENPAQAAEIAREHTVNGKDVAQNLEIIKIRNQTSVSELTREKGLGWFDLALMDRVGAVFHELGLIQQPVDMRDIFTNDLVADL